ncbi:MAG: sensor histidine kinase [Thermodesulfobacteriota bacterium]
MNNDLNRDFQLLKKKEQDYTAYRFKAKEKMAIFAFFDLAQEFTSITSLYRIAVSVIHYFFNYEACIYTIRPEDETLMLQSCTAKDPLEAPIPARADVVVQDSPYRLDSSFFFPIIGKKALADKVPVFFENQTIGILEIFPAKQLNEHQILFFQKYANRVGFNMHNKLAVEQNIEHIRFINELVSDIEHNVITPNLYYKAFLINMKKDLQKHLAALDELNSGLSAVDDRNHPRIKKIRKVSTELGRLQKSMAGKMEDFENHFNHLSLFIETLFRREHFAEGGYVLKRGSYNLLNDIFLPELEHYKKRFIDKDIEIIEPSSIPTDEELTIFIDLGLTAQVFANLLSNALKYCQEASDENGVKRKYISYWIEVLTEESPKRRKALKFSLFNTGRPISQKDAHLIFEDLYKRPEDQDIEGSGHGLHFVKQIVQLQEGYVGYTPRENGNEFFIVLPKRRPREKR